MPGYVSSDSDSSECESSHSSVSFDGVPDVDLEHLQDQVKAQEIKQRRDVRRRVRFNNQFRGEVQRSVRNDITYGLSKAADQSQTPTLTQVDSSLLDIFNKDISFLELRKKFSVMEIQGESKLKKPTMPIFTDLDKMKEQLKNAMNFEEETQEDNNFSVTFQPGEQLMVNKGT